MIDEMANGPLPVTTPPMILVPDKKLPVELDNSTLKGVVKVPVVEKFKLTPFATSLQKGPKLAVLNEIELPRLETVPLIIKSLPVWKSFK